MSDMMHDRLVTTEGQIGRKGAEVIALGNMDGCARYLERDLHVPDPELRDILDDVERAAAAK